MWYVIGRYKLDPPDDAYEEILERVYTFDTARMLGKDYAPWFGEEWDILLRHADHLNGNECDIHGKVQ